MKKPHKLILKETRVRGSLSKLYVAEDHRHHSASPLYYHLHADGCDYLFTPHQMNVAKFRAMDNEHNIVKIKPWYRRTWGKIRDWFYKLFI